MAASFTAPVPASTTPSTGTRAPALTSTVAPAGTSWAATVRWEPSASSSTAVSGAVATRSERAARVLDKVASSRAWPREKRRVTAADSQKLPSSAAPIAATATSRSMPTVRTRSAWTAPTTIGRPAMTAAASMSSAAAR